MYKLQHFTEVKDRPYLRLNGEIIERVTPDGKSVFFCYNNHVIIGDVALNSYTVVEWVDEKPKTVQTDDWIRRQSSISDLFVSDDFTQPSREHDGVKYTIHRGNVSVESNCYKFQPIGLFFSVYPPTGIIMTVNTTKVKWSKYN
jgi:hypothetical protein